MEKILPLIAQAQKEKEEEKNRNPIVIPFATVTVSDDVNTLIQNT